jgi:hypothetical protein
MVALSLDKDAPSVLLRERPRLVETFTYEFRQPYHTAEKIPLDKAREFISRVESGAKHLAEEAIHSAQRALRERGYQLTQLGLPLSSAKPLPNLEKILSSHALIHTADGELFRQALIHAGQCCNLVVFTSEERELSATACKSLGMKRDGLARVLIAIGRPVGAPWSQDEKLAALSAWLALKTALSRARRTTSAS